MTLNRWDPLRDLLNFQERVNRCVDSISEQSVRARACWSPLIDMLETPEAYIFRAELPGVNREDINIEISGHRLRISGERQLDVEPQLAVYHRVERAHGPFERNLVLPEDVDVENTEAKCRDGVLEISIPKCEGSRERVLTVISLR